jgi:hypothetical protein
MDMVKIRSVVQLIEKQANPIERLRLRYLLTRRYPSPTELGEFQSSQRSDGGWPPFWALNYSSLDATCFRLAQAEQMGLSAGTHPFLDLANRFLVSRQRPAGCWEEDSSVIEMAPPWARPGNLAARLYLTANCALWLSQTDQYRYVAWQAANFISAYIDPTGALPSFVHTHWLSAALLYRLSQVEKADGISKFLLIKVESMSASELSWLLNAFFGIQSTSNTHLIGLALARLVSLQQEDGRWVSDDGAAFDVHTTLETLFVLSRYGKASF